MPFGSDSPLMYKSFPDVYGIIKNKIKSQSKTASRYIYLKLNLDYEHVSQDQVFQGHVCQDQACHANSNHVSIQVQD